MPYAGSNNLGIRWLVSHGAVWVASARRSNRTLFGLTTLAPGASPAYADATNATADLSDCFNFNQTPQHFRPSLRGWARSISWRTGVRPPTR